MGNENTVDQQTENEDELHDAVASAIDEVTITPENDNDDSDADDAGNDPAGEGTDDEPGDRDAGSAADNEEENEPGESGESKDEEAADGEGEKAGKDDDAAADESDSEGDAEDDGDEPDGQGDHVNDPIPEGINKRTATRIQSLISDVKELSVARDERDEIVEAINRVGASPEQYAGALTVIGLFNSDNREDKVKALEIVRGMERDLALEVGDARGHVKLDDYPDLLADIEAGALSEERAIEIANMRASEAHRKEKKTQADEQTQATEQTQANIEKGRKELNDLGVTLQGDPAYAVLGEQFAGLLQSTLRNVHPTRWAATAKDVWSQLKAANPAAGAVSPPPPPPPPPAKNRPLRVKGGGSGNKAAEASSALDALDGALDGL